MFRSNDWQNKLSFTTSRAKLKNRFVLSSENCPAFKMLFNIDSVSSKICLKEFPVSRTFNFYTPNGETDLLNELNSIL